MTAINFTGWWTGKTSRKEQKEEVFRKILSGEKTTTIRAVRRDRRIPCRGGSMLQLYWGMRQGDCEKISDVRCVRCSPITIFSESREIRSTHHLFDGVLLDAGKIAKADGFDDLELFWGGFETGLYYLIEWEAPK